MTVTAREWNERERAQCGQPDEAELARIGALGPEERWETLGGLCREAMTRVRALPEPLRSEVLWYRDPLPASSEAALRRMRAEYAARRNA